MKAVKTIVTLFLVTNIFALQAAHDSGHDEAREPAVVWMQGLDVEQFWLAYADSKGGLTWGITSEYPEYSLVKEGDTLLVVLPQGKCLMEFFHSRWRRANDVRRWDDSMNDYGACPYVFD